MTLKIKQRLFVLMSVFLCTLPLSACGSKTVTQQPVLEVYGSANDVISFWDSHKSSTASWSIRTDVRDKNMTRAVFNLPNNMSGSDLVKVTRDALNKRLSYKLSQATFTR
jgi:hypothetical protein